MIATITCIGREAAVIRHLLALVVFLLVTAAADLGWSGDSPDGEPQRIVISQGLAPVSTLVFVANDQDFWAEEGLDVRPETFISGKLCLDAVLWGKADVATVAETPVVLAAFQKKKVRVICTIAEDFLYVLARRSSGISEPADLAGKRVATLMNTSAEFFMDRFLGTHGLIRDDMKVTNLRPADMIFGLIRGDIDAYFIWEPNVYFAERELGGDAVRFSGEGIYTETFNIVVTEEFANDNPEVLEKILRALLKAERFVHENKDRSIDIVADVIGMDREALEQIWDNYNLRVKLDRSLLEFLTQQGRWAVDSGIVGGGSTEPDYPSLILSSPLRALRPEAVTLDANPSGEPNPR
jgi:NitT/TauT family transport system substrate-binding protein